jgi:hypothetical protein
MLHTRHLSEQLLSQMRLPTNTQLAGTSTGTDINTDSKLILSRTC